MNFEKEADLIKREVEEAKALLRISLRKLSGMQRDIAVASSSIEESRAILENIPSRLDKLERIFRAKEQQVSFFATPKVNKIIQSYISSIRH